MVACPSAPMATWPLCNTARTVVDFIFIFVLCRLVKEFFIYLILIIK
jgi:hypothetical protein